MFRSEKSGFLSGVIEGFYGPPWSTTERMQWFDRMAGWGMNTYFYCLKDDAKNRAIWRETYSPEEAAALTDLIGACRSRGIRFVYGLSPGLDIRYTSEADSATLRRRFEQMLGLGCRDFALLFDDIPDRMEDADLARWGSLAAAQCAVTNALHAWTRERAPEGRFLFCPTPYCSRMLSAKHGGAGYLQEVGEALDAAIDVLWTGSEIISPVIGVAHVEDLQRLLRRKPVIWDNLHANDYDGRRFFCGPYSGRPIELKQAVSGILTNPNCEYALNEVPFRTFADYLRTTDTWRPREAYLNAMKEWHSNFATFGHPLELEDLVFLGDCYYLPHEEGSLAVQLYGQLRDLLERDPSTWGSEAAEIRERVVRLRDICARMANLRSRPLFYALSRRIWELREEMDLLDRYLTTRIKDPGPDVFCGSDFHLPGTYRGGMVAKLQRLLVQTVDGNFDPATLRP